jgi:hypothetical protein
MAQLVGPGLIGAAGPTSQTWTSPFPHRPGDKARDRDGNEYIFCNFVTTNVSGGVLVLIDSEHAARPLLGTARVGGRVGVAMTGATAGTDAGWVQVYGVHFAVQGNGASDTLVSDQTVDYHLIPQTSVSTPSGTLSLVARETGTSIEATLSYIPIRNMWLVPSAEVSDLDHTDALGTSTVSAASGPVTAVTATTNGTSMHTGLCWPVFLNYPYVDGITVPTPMHNATS